MAVTRAKIWEYTETLNKASSRGLTADHAYGNFRFAEEFRKEDGGIYIRWISRRFQDNRQAEAFLNGVAWGIEEFEKNKDLLRRAADFTLEHGGEEFDQDALRELIKKLSKKGE